ncbi:MAG: KUP/HAK/KT family potassium transporter [Kiritimatiellia bacterium]
MEKPPIAESGPSAAAHASPRHALLVLGALGVVYGDIGTSPIYALRECINGLEGLDRRVAVLGSLSLIFWLLMLIVCVKYLAFVTRADNNGEGGSFTLLALVRKQDDGKKIGLFALAGLAGASLLYGEGIITPAISVISAAEGLKTLSAALTPWIPWIAAIILFALFAIQHHGTGRIGVIFGPVMVVWFVSLGFLGLHHLVAHPSVLAAVNPMYALHLIFGAPGKSAIMVGAAVLAITGVEALYADMGHFGRRAIVQGWYFMAMPGLLLNYFGQGAYALEHPEADELFFALAGHGAVRIGLVALSFLATVIASQALISGTFSLTRQAIRLGYVPRMKIDHTNEGHEGQIYLPGVNTILAAGSIALVLGFRTSGNLAAAYGLAVTGTMAMTTVAFQRVAREHFGWKRLAATVFLVCFLTTDLSCFSANLHKIPAGGWVPLLVGSVILLVMVTWKVGRANISSSLAARELPIQLMIDDIVASEVHRTPGAAVFMAGRSEGVPVVLLHTLKWNRCIQKNVVLLNCITPAPAPGAGHREQLELTDLGGFWRAIDGGLHGTRRRPRPHRRLARGARPPGGPGRGGPARPRSRAPPLPRRPHGPRDRRPALRRLRALTRSRITGV